MCWECLSGNELLVLVFLGVHWNVPGNRTAGPCTGYRLGEGLGWRERERFPRPGWMLGNAAGHTHIKIILEEIIFLNSFKSWIKCFLIVRVHLSVGFVPEPFGVNCPLFTGTKGWLRLSGVFFAGSCPSTAPGGFPVLSLPPGWGLILEQKG